MNEATKLTLPEQIDAQKLYPPIVHNIEVSASVDDIWNIISKPGNLPSYHPFVERNDAQSWNEKSALDELSYFSGLTLKRQVYTWLDGEGYDLIIGQSLSSPNCIVSWRVTPLAIGISQFQISLYLINYTNKLQNSAVRDRFSRYLVSIVKGLAYLAVEGKTVVEDQFGSVEGFSRN